MLFVVVVVTLIALHSLIHVPVVRQSRQVRQSVFFLALSVSYKQSAERYALIEQCCRSAGYALIDELGIDVSERDRFLSEHIDCYTGWLSITLINYILKVRSVLRVDNSHFDLCMIYEVCRHHAGVMLDWNRLHWTVLRSEGDVLIHMNGIDGHCFHHGIKQGLEFADVEQLIKSGIQQYHGCTAHVVVCA